MYLPKYFISLMIFEISIIENQAKF